MHPLRLIGLRLAAIPFQQASFSLTTRKTTNGVTPKTSQLAGGLAHVSGAAPIGAMGLAGDIPAVNANPPAKMKMIAPNAVDAA